ncbi:hypothetical protein CYMTET_15104 [Cymbomonas tetramitiformis]|uniref:Uncharacterized protein n=1 Tax=Cymbomonas tetramitiformis TaxID=36881 RepID=A0AAE0GF63_9CHLO|nr:hypothetical protein CYMTET_15104 [Cymbomonas tetramitiformis]
MDKALEAKRAKAVGKASPLKKAVNTKAMNKVSKQVTEAGPSKNKKRKSDVVSVPDESSEEESEEEVFEDCDLYIDDNITDENGEWPEHWDDCGPSKFAEWRENGPWVTLNDMNEEKALRRQTQERLTKTEKKVKTLEKELKELRNFRVTFHEWTQTFRTVSMASSQPPPLESQSADQEVEPVEHAEVTEVAEVEEEEDQDLC